MAHWQPPKFQGLLHAHGLLVDLELCSSGDEVAQAPRIIDELPIDDLARFTVEAVKMGLYAIVQDMRDEDSRRSAMRRRVTRWNSQGIILTFRSNAAQRLPWGSSPD